MAAKRKIVKNPYAVSPTDFDKAHRLYREFRESAPRRGRTLEFTTPKVLMVMGTLSAVEYETTRGRKLEKYRHVFHAGSRPFICADAKTGLLFLVEGRYRVTKRGIVDLDPRGKELD